MNGSVVRGRRIAVLPLVQHGDVIGEGGEIPGGIVPRNMPRTRLGRGLSCNPVFLGQRNAEVGSEGIRRFERTDAVIAGDEVDDVPVGTAGETVEAFVHLHGRVTVVVEGTAGHAVPGNDESAGFGDLPGGNAVLDGFENVAVRRLYLL